jgi:hypothetical protein
VDCEATIKMDLVGLCKAQAGLDSQFFSPEQVACIGKFFAGGFFTHFRLYSFCFSNEQDLTQYSETLLVETPLIPSFEAAIPEIEWQAMLEERQRQAEAEQKAAEEAEAARVEAEAQERREREQAEAEAARAEELARVSGAMGRPEESSFECCDSARPCLTLTHCWQRRVLLHQ